MRLPQRSQRRILLSKLRPAVHHRCPRLHLRIPKHHHHNHRNQQQVTTSFDTDHPNAPVGFQPPHSDNDDGATKIDTLQPCWNCGTPTAYVDLGFEAHLCSEGFRPHITTIDKPMEF